MVVDKNTAAAAANDSTTESNPDCPVSTLTQEEVKVVAGRKEREKLRDKIEAYQMEVDESQEYGSDDVEMVNDKGMKRKEIVDETP